MKTKAKKSKVPRRKSRRVHNDACVECGTVMVSKVGTWQVPIHGERFPIQGVTFLKCPKCTESMIDLKEASRADGVAKAQYRAKHNLLSAEEIRAIRERFGLTREELAALLRATEFEVSRWESGRFPQSATMDTLLHMIRDVPKSIDYLRKRAA